MYSHQVNEPYGDPYFPFNLGSGGGAIGEGPGGNGGGLFVLSVGELVLDGIIKANGGNAYPHNHSNLNYSNYSGAGSGGGILLVAHTFSGNGSIHADGGNFTNYSGLLKASAGGGGRVAVWYQQLGGGGFDFTKITAAGGIYTVEQLDEDDARLGKDGTVVYYKY